MVKWLPEYPVKKNFMGDLISGITVAVMHIPQGAIIIICEESKIKIKLLSHFQVWLTEYWLEWTP